jgi:hypothetical protein
MAVQLAYPPVVPLLACPFCREMFEEGERQTCPVCAMQLTAFEKLPPSPHSTVDDDGIPVAPEHEPLRHVDLRRGKGLILALGLVGLILFFLPWMNETLPDVTSFSGFAIARRSGWTWAPACAWMVLVPTVLSRRSIAQLRGARAIAVFLAFVPAFTVALLIAFPPHRAFLRFTWGWPMYATLAVSLAAAVSSLRLGGRVDDITVSRGSSEGQTRH